MKSKETNHTTMREEENQWTRVVKQRVEKECYLSNGMLTTIFQFMQNSSLIHTMGLVNKQWRQAMLQPCIWKTRVTRQRTIDEFPESFLQFCKQCQITKFTVLTYRHINEIMNKFSKVITELNIMACLDMELVSIDVPVFPEMQKFVCEANIADCRETMDLISGMKKLTSLEIYINNSYKREFEQVLYSCKTLKSLKLTAYLFQQNETIELFKQLPLLEEIDIRFDGLVSSSVWNSVFQIKGVSDRMRTMNIFQGKSTLNLLQNEPYKLQINNLKQLSISGMVSQHSDLLYCSQHTLERLSLDKSDNIDTTTINLPKLKSLTLYRCDCKVILDILLSCNQTIEQLVLQDPRNYNGYIPVDLTLPKIKYISCDIDTSDFYSSLLEAIEGNNLVKLVFSFDVGPTLLRSIPTIATKMRMLTSLRISSSHAKDTESWFVTILNNCKYMHELSFLLNSRSATDLEELQVHRYLEHLEVNYSIVQNNTEIVLKNTPNLNYIYCEKVELSEYSKLLGLLNIYPVSEISITIHPTLGYTLPFKSCHYLNNSTVRNVSLDILDSDSEVRRITYEQLLLAIICIASAYSNDKFVFSIHNELDPSVFLGKYYKDSMKLNEKTLESIQNKLIPEVVSMIRGITNEQREKLFNSLRNRENQLMANVLESVSNV
jgi:hypothetical protein